MIIVKLQGGLGNQMFQYAAGRALSIKHNVPLLLDLSFFKRSKQSVETTFREFQLNIFPNLSSIETFNMMSGTHNFGDFKFFKETLFEFNSEFLNLPPKSILDGYFQTSKYFSLFKSQICRDFVFGNSMSLENSHLLNQILESNSVSIHIRRSDYVANINVSKIHKVCSMNYYLDAIQFISEQIKNIELYIFSDDMIWAKENFAQIPQKKTFISNNADCAYLDMLLMSQCKHNIIANSSFSWWAGYLNNNVNKLIIAPKNWFVNDIYSINDLIPQNWIKL